MDEDDHGHDPLLLRTRRPESRLLLSQVAMGILPFSLGIGRADLLFFTRYAMTTSTAIYYGREEDGCPPPTQWPGSMTREWQLRGPCKSRPSFSRLLRSLQVKGGSWSWRESKLLLSQVVVVILLFFLGTGRADPSSLENIP